MSKAVTNEEVEDVLSSIRRLVSEDKRPLAGLRSAPLELAPQDVVETVEGAATHAADPVSDRLVLTPALRVAEPQEGDATRDQDEGPLDLGSVARETWSDSEHDAQGDAQTNDAEDDGPMILFPQSDAAERASGDNPAMDAVDALVHDALEAAQEDASQTDDEAEGDYSDESYWAEDAASEEPAAPEHHHEDDQHEEQQDHASDEIEDEDMAHASEADAQDTPEEVAYHEMDPAQQEQDYNQNDAMPTGDPDISILPLTAKIAALEAAVGGINQEWEPDGTEEQDLSSPDTPAMAWEDDVDLDAKGAPVQEVYVEEIAEEPVAEEAVAQEDQQSIGGAVGGDDQLLDEEALRELVSEIVRSELQGALGERITRNVRKLVRREIHRALTAQELE